MKKQLIVAWVIVFISMLPVLAQAIDKFEEESMSGDKVKEEIWALEEAYFANLYKADYEALLALVHSQFLGWPGSVAQPIDKEGSERFMKQLVPKPTSCTFTIERGGIRVLGEVALTQYTIHVTCSDTTAAAKTQSSRINHTWVKELDGWKLLGGMSYDQ